LVLCTLQTLVLTGCEANTGFVYAQFNRVELFFKVQEIEHRGCKTSQLYERLLVNGKSGLTEKQVYDSGMTVCMNPRGLDKGCSKPVPHIYNEVDVHCPFLFNVWELPQERQYGKGEAKVSRDRLVAQCLYNRSVDVEPKWCFSDWCQETPINCFTSWKAAEDARPWDRNAQSAERPGGTKDASGVQEPTKELQPNQPKTGEELMKEKTAEGPSPTHHHEGEELPSNSKSVSEMPSSAQSEVESEVPSTARTGKETENTNSASEGVSEGTAQAEKDNESGEAQASPAPASPMDSLVQTQDETVSHQHPHEHRGARRSSLQVTQTAFVVGRP